VDADAADVAIVGAGAAGLATAIFTRRLLPTAAVRVVDGARKPGAKILVSGGARCNVTNAVVSELDFWGGRSTIVRRVLNGLPVPETIAFFDEIGVPLREEPGGKLFPVSNRARDVLAALMSELRRVGAVLDAPRRVHEVAPAPGGFHLSTSTGPLLAQIVVLATGGRSLPKTGSDGAGMEMARRLGHSIVETTPALAPLILEDSSSVHHDLGGVAVEAELTIWVNRAVAIRLTGPLLWTHFGVSGPVALNASRHWERAQAEGRQVAVTANFRPGETFDDVEGWLSSLALSRPTATIARVMASRFPASFGAALLGACGVDPALVPAQLPRESRRRLAHALVAWPLPVAGTRGYDFAEATAGGIALGEIDPRSMESRVCPGLYLTGEMLDVDGRIGGFNFQWAWASAAVAAHGVARRLAAHRHGA
jgi:predicted Rossmann fold flavoprotein